MPNQSTEAAETVGWVSSPDGRGTLDIMWSCFLVITTATWTVLHINIPKEGEFAFSITLRKARWALWAVDAPEHVMLVSALQWSSARVSRKAMCGMGVDHWSISHGFRADCGGFVLETSDQPRFPINSRALCYLVSKGYVEAPNVTQSEIQDRSKEDRLVKIIALVQCLYHVTQVVARTIQQLHVSCLEVITLAFLCCTAPTYFFWLEKPLDVEVPIRITANVPTATILREAGDLARETYSDTPMDFLERPGWNEWRRRQRFTHLFGLSERPIRRIPNDYVTRPSFWLAFWTWVITVCHAAIHMAGWNLAIASIVETYLWRAASICLFAILFTWGFVEVFSMRPGFEYTITLLGIWIKESKSKSLWHHWALDGPAIFASIAYYLARTIVIISGFTTLRRMPTSTYETVEWTNMLPHWQ